MNRVLIKRGLVVLVMLTLTTILFATKSSELDANPLINYLGAVSGRKIVYDITFSNKTKNINRKQKELIIECQNIEIKKDYVEVMFGRTDLDEPVYLNVFKDKILDASIGGIIIKMNTKPGDAWENVGKKNNRLLSKVEVIELKATQVVAGIKYSNCMTLLVHDYRSQTVEKRVYAYGVGLIQEINYDDAGECKPIAIKTIKSYSDK